MFLSLKAFILLLDIVGVATGQMLNVNNIMPNTSNTLNVSERCLKVLDGKNLISNCDNSIQQTKTSGKIKTACDAPIDGKASHFCTNNQLIKMLETMESSCKDELEKKQESVWGRYADLLEYPLTRDLVCKKDIDGVYCIEKTTKEGLLAGCYTCTILLAKAQTNWNPIRSNSFTKEILIERCDMVTNNSSSSSNNSDNSSNFSSSFTGYSHYIFNVATIGSTAFVIIGAMVLSH
ncbi:hypothetical protein BDF19DRAFT_441178 [Syncephalis fuscata]|nr:hypothetical protein BDF19DRAFT_441178 [Syncephalis fuscata]